MEDPHRRVEFKRTTPTRSGMATMKAAGWSSRDQDQSLALTAEDHRVLSRTLMGADQAQSPTSAGRTLAAG